jgi:hypothetical protein
MLLISHVLFHKVSNVFAVITIISHRLCVYYTYFHAIIDKQVTIIHFVPVL